MATKTEKVKKKTAQAVTSKITATSRMSIKKGETYYTLEYSEERLIPDADDIELSIEREALWNTVNAEVDRQIADIEQSYKEAQVEREKKRKY